MKRNTFSFIIFLLSFCLLRSVAAESTDPLAMDTLDAATFRGMQQLTDPVTGFPVDIAFVEDSRLVHRVSLEHFNKTSPTNIGLGVLSLILGIDRSHSYEQDAYQNILKIVTSLEKLKKHEGFPYNWYYLPEDPEKDPEVIFGGFVSSLDSGILDLCLMAAAARFPQTELEEKIEAWLSSHDYRYFEGKTDAGRKHGLLNLGYDTTWKMFSGSDYGILMTEARMVVLMAILKDGLPETAWSEQARIVKSYKTQEGAVIPVVAPWGGGIYETVFADEILGGHRIAPHAFRDNAENVIQIHREEGQKTMPEGLWGWSNGAVPGTERYGMVGVAEIAYNRHPGNFLTPYSSFLALAYDPEAALSNLNKMRRLFADVYSEGFGFVDSLDAGTGVVHNRVLALDKGIEYLALANYRNNLEDKKTIPDYLWEYFEKKGWKKTAHRLLQSEENHPSFRALSRLADKPAAKPWPLKNLLSLLEGTDHSGTFAEENRARAEWAWEDDQTFSLSYDISERSSYGGCYLHFPEIQAPENSFLRFRIRGNDETGYPQTVKFELKHKGRYAGFDHVALTGDWQEILYPLPPGISFDEWALVVENGSAGTGIRGSVQVNGLSISEFVSA